MGGPSSGRFGSQHSIQKHFTAPTVGEHARSRDWVQCKHCKKVSRHHITRQKKHLEDECPGYRMARESTSQLPINFAASSKRQLDRLCGKAIYTGARPFALFESDAMQEFIHALNPTYHTPDRGSIADRILQENFEEVQQKMMAELRGTEYINVSFDESTNIVGHRIMVMTLITPKCSWLYCLEDMQEKRLDARGIADWVHGKLTKFLSDLNQGGAPDFSCLNSFSTDTCSTMRLAWETLRLKPELKHIFFIPCDSHGIQLIFKDLLEGQDNQLIREVFEGAGTVVSFFHRSPLEYARLRKKQVECYGGPKSLIASCITRWGTQYDLLHSVTRSQEALREWAKSFLPSGKSTIAQKVKNTLTDPTFWVHIFELLTLLRPLHIAQKESEANNVNIMGVVDRWIGIESHLLSHVKTSSFCQELEHYLSAAGWRDRIEKQLTPLHWLAYFLDHRRLDKVLLGDRKDRVHVLLKGLSPEGKLLRDFLLFRHKRGAFSTADYAEEDPSTFWLIMADEAPSLSLLAHRLFNTVANSAAAERSFSGMNAQHTKTRNRLAAAQVAKLVFVSMNDRALQGLHPATSHEDEEEFEYSLLALEDVEMEKTMRLKDVLGAKVALGGNEVISCSDAGEANEVILGKRPCPFPAP